MIARSVQLEAPMKPLQILGAIALVLAIIVLVPLAGRSLDLDSRATSGFVPLLLGGIVAAGLVLALVFSRRARP